MILSDKIFHILVILGLTEFWFQICNVFNLCTFYFYRFVWVFTVYSITAKKSANNKMLFFGIPVKNNEQYFVEKILLSGNHLDLMNKNKFSLWFEWFSFFPIPIHFLHSTYSKYFFIIKNHLVHSINQNLSKLPLIQFIMYYEIFNIDSAV